MPISVKLVLPPNFQNRFLNNDFVLNNGDNYFSGKLNLSPSITGNKVSLTFGINLVDTDLREPVDLKTIKTLQISNDPNFNTSKTIVINDWPYDSTAYDPLTNNKVTGSNKNFIFTIDPEAFIDPDNVSLGSRSVDNSGSDLFIIENWPLSANGGLSAVYFKISAESINGDIAGLPSGEGLYDQIYWQPESGVRPGKPKLVTRADGYTGKKSLFRFEAAQEGASNLYGTGVARYSADIIEHRPLPSTDAEFEQQFSSNRSTNIYRTIFPDVLPSNISNLPNGLVRWDFVPSIRSYSLGTPGTLAVNTSETKTLTADQGTRLQFVVGGKLVSTIKAPDYFAQANFSLALSNELSEFNITLGLCKIELTQATTPSETNQVEIKVNFNNDGYGAMPTSYSINRLSGSENVKQSTVVSRQIIKDLADGGTLEIYLSKLKRPSSVITPNAYDEKYIMRAYFTADSDKTRSYLLGSATLDNLSLFDYGESIHSFITFECISGQMTYTFKELVNGTGRILLDVDLGDCKNDNVAIDTSITTKTSYDDWANAITNNTWYEFDENDSTAGSGSVSDGYYLIADIPTTDGQNRSYAEIDASMPSFSDRTKINFDLQIVQGQFYVALSPIPSLTDGITPDRPMGSRCDESNENSSEYLNKPTLMIKFDQLRNNISLVHRKVDNSIESKILAPYKNVATTDLSGTITFDGLSTNIYGTGTLFTTEMSVGDKIYNSPGDLLIGTVTEILSDLWLQVDAIPDYSDTDTNYKKSNLRYLENIELLISNSPVYGDGVWVTIKRNGELLTSYKQAGDLPTARMGAGWYVSMGTRSNLGIDYGTEVNAPTNSNSRAYVGNVNIVGLPPKMNIEETDLVNQRHFLKATAGAAYLKPLMGQLMLASNSEFRDFAYKSNNNLLEYRYFVQEFTPKSRTEGENSLYPHLLELMVEDTRQITKSGQILEGPKIKIFNRTAPTTTDNTSYIGSEITPDWIDGELQTLTSVMQSGFNVPNNNLIQFDISAAFASTTLTSSTKYYLVIKVPKGINVARAKGFDFLSTEVFVDNTNTALPEGLLPSSNLQGTGWQIVPWVWFKLFHGFRERYDNVYHEASLQVRVTAESHALVSSDSSGLSKSAIVDREGPVCTDGDITSFSTPFKAMGFNLPLNTKPVIVTALQPGVRSTILNVFATDSLSGNWLFRVAKETDFGTVFYTDWQDWDAFKKRDNFGNLIDDEIIYTVYHYGSWWKSQTGADDPYTNSLNNAAQNMGTDGPRKLWVETMDKVGNISQSYPVNVSAQLIGLVDTMAPSSDVSIIAPDEIDLDYTNQSEVIVKIMGSDTVSSVKDVRFRLLDGAGTGEFSPWYPYSDIIKKSIIPNSPSAFVAFAGPDAGGLDGGNTGDGGTGGNGGNTGGTDGGSSTPDLPDSGNDYGTSGSPGTKRLEVQVRDFGNNAQQPSGVWNTLYKDIYTSRNEFSVMGVTEFDRNFLVVDSTTWLNPVSQIESVYLSAIKFYEFLSAQITFEAVTSWPIENENAYEIISLATGTYRRKIFVGDNDTIELVINGVEYNRASASNDETVSAPKFYIDTAKGYLVVQDLPGSTPTSLFDCNVYKQEAQIWKWDTNSFERVINLGPLGERVILCMQPLSDRLLLGSGNGNLWSYDGANVSGPIFETSDLDGNVIPITAFCLHQFLHESTTSLYVGTGSKSYLYRVPLSSISTSSAWKILNLEPLYDKNYTITAITSAYNSVFISTDSGKVFKYERKLNKTDEIIITETTATFTLKKSEIDVYESSILPVSSINSFSNQVLAGIGDRPEVHSYTEKLRPVPGINNEVLSDHDFSCTRLTDVYLATAAPLAGTWVATNNTLTRTTLGALSIDGNSTMGINYRVLIKNQADPKQNGIYVVTIKGGASTSTVLTRAMDFSYQSKIKGNTYVLVTSGSTNANSTMYLNTDDYIEVGIDNNSWSTSKTSFAHYFSAWSTNNFTKAFVQDPGGWSWQFYFDGDTNSRNKPDVVRSFAIDDKQMESGVREVMSLTGIANKSIVFTTEDGSDWEQAVNRLPSTKEPFTVDFEVRHESGSGKQGFEVADGYHIVNVKFSTSAITVTSGTSTVTKNFINRNDIFTPYSIVEQTTPQIGAIKTWNYALTATSEDTNSVFPSGYGTADAQGWVSKKFSTVEAKTETNNTKNIKAVIATTANLSATYYDGPNPASPGVGAYLEFNTAGSQTIDTIVLKEGTLDAFPHNATEANEVAITYSPNSKIIYFTDTAFSISENGLLAYVVGQAVYDKTNDRYLGIIESIDGGTFPTAINFIKLKENIPNFTTGTTVTGVITPFFVRTLVLVKNQTNKNENGLYHVERKGSTSTKAKLVRSPLFDEQSEMSSSTVVTIGPWSRATPVVSGASNHGKSYFLTVSEGIIVGNTSTEWTYNSTNVEVGTDHYLEVTSALQNGIKGDPIIGVENLSPIVADTNTYLLVRFRFTDYSDENNDGVLDFDDYVRTVTTTNVSLSGLGLSGSADVANATISIGQRVLVKSQDDPKQNGVYVVAAGSWTRAIATDTTTYVSTTDYLLNNSRLKVTAGDYVNKIFYLHYDGIFSLGNSELNYYESIFNPIITLKTYWSSVSSISDWKNYNYTSSTLSINKNYQTVLINPAWMGPIRSLYFEFEDFSKHQFALKPKIQIDYVSILTNAGYYTITRELTPVRLSLSGSNRTDLRVWVGNFVDPIIEIDNFADQQSDKSYVRFGKLTPDSTASSWVWGSFRYHIGHAIPPVVPEAQGFYPSFRFPSSGGVRKIVQHSGTAWCLTDGYYNSAATDNPDDFIFKAWSYIPDQEIWKLESPNSPRIRNTKGMIRALSATSYRDTLIVSGQVGTIVDENSMPTE